METGEGNNSPRPVMGRPTKYRPEYCREILEHFDVDFITEREITFTNKKGETWTKSEDVPVHLNFLSAFARKIGVCHDTLNEWCKVYPEFSAAHKKAKALQKEHLITCGLLGLFNAASWIFTAKNIADMHDKTESEQLVITRKGPALTIEEIQRRLEAEKAAGTGLDMRSIEGGEGQ